jgi:small-conductance mechanosensitive channel
MQFKKDSVILILAASLVAVGYGAYSTGRRDPSAAPRTTRRAPGDRSIVVDQSSLMAAEQLVRLPTTSDERLFAEDALRLADQEMDLAFAQAVRQSASQTRPLSPEAKEIDAQLQKGLRALAADEAVVKDLTAALAKASPLAAESITDRLNLAKAQLALDQDEVDDARQDLRRAGGDPQGRMQAMIEEHDAASRSSDSVHVNVTAATDGPGLVRRVQALQALRAKQSQIERAKAAADSLADVFKKRHDRMEARAARLRDSAVANLSHDSAAALLAQTQRTALAEKARATLDQRVDNQHRLSDVYTGWIAVVSAQERVVVNRVLKGLAVILCIVLFGILLARWTERLLRATTMDRRRSQTLHMVTRVSLQVVAVLLILLVVFGPPDNLGTFLGLAGAGLTVALKDFIVGFLGWFVLMGKNGIRIGDLVEINGVTGEVVELGMFYTVLLETGSWNESGHPTGRRVTFTNGFAIEGHYFNFSTSGQWLWDEVRIEVPSGHDPYPIVDAIQKEVDEATADSARQAEAEWKGSRRSPHLTALTGAPAVSLKPVAGGVEIIARYVTRASERAKLRTRLYHTVIGLLGGATAPMASR